MSERTIDLVRDNLGSMIRDLLNDPDIIDIFVRPDWVAIDRLKKGFEQVPSAVGTVRIADLLRLLGPLVGTKILFEQCVVELALPGYGARFSGMYLGPNGIDSFFSIRKAVVRGMSLESYRDQGTFSSKAFDYFDQILQDPRHGMAVSGQTASGKTTFLTTCMGHIIRLRGNEEHFVMVEDTPEISINAPMLTSIISTIHFPFRAALRASLRHSPTRLIVGEVRGAEALDAVKAGGTGPGLLLTIHANSLEGAARTLYARMLEGTDGRVDTELIPQAIQTIAVFRKINHQVKLHDLGILRSMNPLTVERLPI